MYTSIWKRRTAVTRRLWIVLKVIDGFGNNKWYTVDVVMSLGWRSKMAWTDDN